MSSSASYIDSIFGHSHRFVLIQFSPTYMFCAKTGGEGCVLPTASYRRVILREVIQTTKCEVRQFRDYSIKPKEK